MTDTDIARRASVQLCFDGENITDDISPYLLSVTYIDSEDADSDDLQIQLQDRDTDWLSNWLEKMVRAERRVETESTVTVTQEVQTGGGDLSVGATVQFLGGPHYVASTAPSPNGSPAPGPATLTIIRPGAPHPYHVIHRDGASRIYGWVNASQVAPLGGGTAAVETVQTVKTVTSTGLKITASIQTQNWNNDGKDRLLSCGEFELDSISASAPPCTVKIRATSLPFTSRIRQTKQSRGWENYTLSRIAREMAEANGMKCACLALHDPGYKRVEQYRCSDIDFLSRLCHDAGLSLKATNNTLVIFDQLEYEGKPPVLDIRRGDGSYLKFRLETGQMQVQYASCRVSYVLPDGTAVEGTAYAADYDAESSSNQQLEIYAPASTPEEAGTLAEKNLRLHNKFERTVEFTFPGNTELVAGVTVLLSGFGLWDGKYIIRQAKHTVSAGGYTTQIQCRRVLGGY